MNLILNVAINNPSDFRNYDTYHSPIYIKSIGVIGTAGLAMGPMGLTYSQQEAESYNIVFLDPNGREHKIVLTP